MSSDVVIRVENLGKRYRIGSRGTHADDLRHRLNSALTYPFRKLWNGAKSKGPGAGSEERRAEGDEQGAETETRHEPGTTNQAPRTKHQAQRTTNEAPGTKHQAPGTNTSHLSPSAAASLTPASCPLPPDTLWALHDVSFEVRQGEILGVIGRNGAGKSTLLKILSRITEPTTGRVEIHGRIGALLEVGTGFHPELTGRENVYLNGMILGMTKPEIDRQFDAIVDFAGVEKFIDTPVKRYSSGMHVRLGFAVAAHLQPEILIVDEVLAVGDVEFQRKCIGKMQSVSQTGRTVLFVSHNMVAVESLCTGAILLDAGVVSHSGEVDDVIVKYVSCAARSGTSVLDLRHHVGRRHVTRPAIYEAYVADGRGKPTYSVRMGESISVVMRFDLNSPIRNPGFGLGVEDQFGRRVFSINNYFCKNANNVPPYCTAATVAFEIPVLPLMPGTYFLTLSLVEDQHTYIDCVERALSLEVCGADVFETGRIADRSQGIVFIDAAVNCTQTT